MKTEYKSISTHTLEGLREVERLMNNGWRIYRTGLFMVWLSRTS